MLVDFVSSCRGEIRRRFDAPAGRQALTDRSPRRSDPKTTVVTTEEGQSLANDFGIQFFETSAKNDINVEKAFVTIAREVRLLASMYKGSGRSAPWVLFGFIRFQQRERTVGVHDHSLLECSTAAISSQTQPI